MNRNIGIIFSFAAGVVVGVVATYKIAETKYQNIADVEIDSVVEKFKNRTPIMFKEPVDEFEDALDRIADDVSQNKKSNGGDNRFSTSKSRVSDYKEVVERVGYDTISSQSSKPKQRKKKKEEVVETMPLENNNIYVISPDEFNTLDGYTTETLYYSADNYVLNCNCNVMSDKEIAETIGHDPAGHFGEYEEDSVHVRNDDLMCDYEILLSQKTHDEIMED